jgi:cysteine-S-conjugate beta-lyase
MAKELSPQTRLSEIARDFAERIETVNLPVVRASSVLFQSLDEIEHIAKGVAAGEKHVSGYATVGTPITFALMDAVAALEGEPHACRAALMPSGLAAITTALFAYLKPGDHMLMTDSVYGPARAFADGVLTRFGVTTEYYEPSMGVAIANLIRPTTRVIYLESPGSYTFEVQDVPAITAVARERGIVTMIDNAWASPLLARPFDWGVDLSIIPLTKYWSGHADVLMGATVVRETLWPTLWNTVRQLGLCVGGDDAYLILRGMRTLSVRLARHQETALAVARWLEARPEVARVWHPAMQSHPQHALWRRDFSGASGLFSFELKDGDRAALAKLCERRRHFRLGYSWGGFESLIMPAKVSTLRSAAPWKGGTLVRLHCGLEDAADLIADLEQGFDAAKRVSS